MKPPTTKQQEARTRNWHIRQLRAFYHLCPPPVLPSVRKKIQKLVDGELKRLRAESETERVENRLQELKQRESPPYGEESST